MYVPSSQNKMYQENVNNKKYWNAFASQPNPTRHLCLRRYLSLFMCIDVAFVFLYLRAMKEGVSAEKGWYDNPYSVSKLGVQMLTRIQQKELDSSRPLSNILVNCVSILN